MLLPSNIKDMSNEPDSVMSQMAVTPLLPIFPHHIMFPRSLPWKVWYMFLDCYKFLEHAHTVLRITTTLEHLENFPW